MPPIVSVVGRSQVGKTTFLEKLIGELKGRGYRIGVIKHSGSGFEIDKPGKDSWRLRQAGGDAVIVSSKDSFAMFKKTDREVTLEEAAHWIGHDFDVILAEGFKGSAAPKIEVHRKEKGPPLFGDRDLLALVTDEILDMTVPQFGLDDARQVADMIENGIMAKRADEISLRVNGAPVPMTPFVSGFVKNTLMGMVTSLKGFDDVHSVEIRVKRGRA